MVIQESKNNPLHTLGNYTPKMTISKVVKFFEKQGIHFTKTMIQNYVRVGVLPVPTDKRYYVRKHLILLVLIENFKVVYSLDEIKRFFEPLLDEDKTNIDIEMVYITYISNKENEIKHIKSGLKNTLIDINSLPKINEDEVILLKNINLMTKTQVSKQISLEF